jgi:hypothetical protein
MIGRARQKKSPGRPVAIDRALDRTQQLRRSLYRVECHCTGTADEHFRVAAGRIEHVEVVERSPAASKERDA